MSIFRPRNPLLRAVVALGSAVWFFVQWHRDKKRKATRGIVDATATVIDDKK